MDKLFKRVSRGFWNYALFPSNVDIDDLIIQYGSHNDYYESIYDYTVDHYRQHISGLKEVCGILDIRFDHNNIIDVTKKVFIGLRDREDKDDLKAKFSVSGTEDVTTNKLVFDFDSTDLEKSRRDTLELCARLSGHGISHDGIQLCFSGHKGFTIEVETDSRFTRKQFENIVNNLSKELDTFDHTVKDEQRLLRIPLTVHNSSKLYKIPLTQKQLSKLPMDTIKLLASSEQVEKNKDRYYSMMNKWRLQKTPSSISKLMELTVEQKEDLDDNLSFQDRLDMSSKPPWMSPARYALHLGFFKKGQRNTAFMILAATYKSHGHPAEVSWRMLKGVAELQAKRTNGNEYCEKKLWNEVIKVVYSPNWKGGTYSEKETKLLKEIRETFGVDEEGDERKLLNILDLSEKFKLFGKHRSKNTIATGIKQLDDNIAMMTGMMVGLLGAPSSGKTSFANLFVRHLSLNNQNVLYESLDMQYELMFGRFLQRETNRDIREMWDQIENGTVDNVLSNAFQKVHKDYQNVTFNFRSGTNVEDIENDIKNHCNTYDDLKLVVVDYLEKIRGPYTDPIANGSYVASRLSDLAKEYNTCILLLLQPQKSAGDPREPLLSMRNVKGSSVIEQDSRVILTMWRPGFNPKDGSRDKYASIAVVKNNIGTLGQYDFTWDGMRGEINTLTERDQYELDELLTEIDEMKALSHGF